MNFPEPTVEHANVLAQVSPFRGGIITRLRVDGVELLSMDRATFDDPAKSVRGGIPLLFPFAGKLDGDTYVPAKSSMKQHGFARNQMWAVGEQRPGFISMKMTDKENTRGAYPHQFSLEQSLTLLPKGALISLLVHNKSKKTPLPVSPGWHPYFSVKSKDKSAITHDVPGLESARFTPDAEFDFGVPAPANGQTRFNIPGLGNLLLSFSPEMRFLQCWGLPGKDFICLEPFFGPNNTINKTPFVIAPLCAHTFWMRVELAG